MALAEARLRIARTGLLLPTALCVMAGGAIAVQSFVNGRLGREIGSAEVAAVINNSVGLVAILVLVSALGVLPRGLAAMRDPTGPRLRWWYLLGGLGGASVVASAALAAPEIGVALLTVALVCGQTGGSLAADRAGISPAGLRAITPARIAGVVLAVVAVTISALGARVHLDPALLAFVIAAGAATAIQAAANGQLARVTGEPLAAALVNFVVGLAGLIVLAALTTGISAPGGWSAPAPLWIGGFMGLAVVLITTITVGHLGVLRLVLALTAGQTAGALLIDLLAPVSGEPVTLVTAVGVVLAFAAVAVSGRDRLR